MNRLVYICFLFIVITSCKSLPDQSNQVEQNIKDTEVKQLAKESQHTLTINEDGEEISYLLFIPDNINERKRWPLMLFLHGAGERGDSLDLVTVHGPPKMARQGDFEEFILLAPQCPTGDYWSTPQQVDRLVALIHYAKESLPVDPSRVYVSGLSMGGYGTWSLLATIPDEIAAAAPICGGGEVDTASRFYDKPIWAFHGDTDSVVPVNLTTDMVAEIEKLGGQPKMTIYEGVGHDSWTEAYNTEELFSWMLSQNLE